VPRSIAAIVLSALALCAAGAASSSAPDAELRVAALGGDSPEVDLSLDLAGGARQPGLIVLYEPAGFRIYPVRPPGSIVGRAFVTAASSSYGTPTFSTLAGDVVAQAPDPVSPCSAAPPIGRWQLELSLLGQPFDIPLQLYGPSAADPVRSAGTVALCVPGIVPGGVPLPIASLDLSLDGIPPPARHGSYVWRAVVTPLAPDGHTLRPETAYELRATLPVPHRLTLTGTRPAGTTVVLLHGRLTANGKPRPDVPIRIVRLSRAVTPGGVSVDDVLLGWTTTARAGTYSFRAHASRTPTFVVVAEPTSGPCRGPAIAPAGCVASTFPATQSDPATIR